MFENKFCSDIGNEKFSKSNLIFSKHIRQIKEEKRKSKDFEDQLSDYFKKLQNINNKDVNDRDVILSLNLDSFEDDKVNDKVNINFKLRKSKSFMYGDNTLEFSREDYISFVDMNDNLVNIIDESFTFIKENNSKEKNKTEITSIDRLRINQFHKHYTKLDKYKNIILKKEISKMIYKLSEDIHKVGLLTMLNSKYKYPRIVIYAKTVLNNTTKDELNKLNIPYTIQYHFYSTDNLSMKNQPGFKNPKSLKNH